MKNKSNIFAVTLLVLVLIPQITFASWWNPFSWFNDWIFREEVPSVVVQPELPPPIEIKNPPTAEPAPEPKKEVKKEIYKPKSTVQTSPPVIVTPPQQPVVSGCASIKGYSSITGLSCSGDNSCANDSFFDKNTSSCINYLTYCQNKNGSNATYDSAKNSCGCATGYTLNSTSTACQVKVVDNSAQIYNQKYQAQYQTVLEKTQQLQEQYDSLIATCPVLTQATGEQGIKCSLAWSQAADVAEYKNAILNNFLTPVTDVSIIYENKLDDFHQQIFQAKMDYHKNVANLSRTAGFMSAYNGELNNLTTAVNAKINAINQQIQFTFSAYKNGVTP